jgi:replicative DNA helicase
MSAAPLGAGGCMTTQKDVNDLLREGSLPKDFVEGTVPMPADPTVRRAALTLVGDDVDARKLPLPSDVHAEAAIAAALLWAGTYAPQGLHIGQIQDLLDVKMLTSAAHKAILRAFLARHEAGQAADVTSVHSDLVARGEARTAGGIEYLDELVANAPPTSEQQLRGHAEAVRDAWARRELITKAREIEKLAKVGKLRAPAAVREAQTLLEDLSGNVAAAASILSSEQVVENIVRRRAVKEVRSFQCGVHGLDLLLGGFWWRETTLIGARTSVGKSALANLLVQNSVAINEEVGAAYITLEMSAELFLNRAAASIARVDADKAARQEISTEEEDRFGAALERLKSAAVYYADSPVQTCESIVGVAHQAAMSLAKRGRRLRLIVIDHLGLIKATDEKAPRDVFAARVSRWTRFLAARFDAAVVGLVQISREAEKQVNDKLPKIHQIKNSGAMEDDADNIVLIHRPKDKRGRFIRGPAQILVAKARNHKTGSFRMGVEPDFVRFVNWEEWKQLKELEAVSRRYAAPAAASAAAQRAGIDAHDDDGEEDDS